MIVNEPKKTTAKQRIVILAIAAFMLFSTAALYIGIVLNYQNSEQKTADAQEKSARFEELYAEYESRLGEQAKELSAKYFDTFKQYRSRVRAYNAADIGTLETEDLVVGTGPEIGYEHDEEGNITTFGTDYAAYYIGWLKDETIFDSSFDSTSEPTALKSPLNGSENMIEGWLEGLDGMRIGGIREITIPSVLGYGSNAQGSILADSPLKFVVMLVEKPTPLEVSDELEQLTQELYGVSFRDSR